MPLVSMSLTRLQYAVKILRTLFYVAFLWTVLQQGFRFLRLYFFYDDDEDVSYAVLDFLLKTLRRLIGTFLYLSLSLFAVGLLISDLAEENDEELLNGGLYAVHQRKLQSGYLKETGTQTTVIIDTDLLFAVGHLISDLAAENDEELLNAVLQGLYAVHQRKLQSGYLKEIGMQTYSVIIDPDTRGIITDDKSVTTSSRSSIKNHINMNPRAIETSSNIGIVRTWQDFINQTFSLHDFDLSRDSRSEMPFGCGKFVVESDFTPVSFEDLAGIEKLKKILNECVIKPFISHPNTSVEAPRAIMFIGGRGSGKTFICKGIVNQLREKTQGDGVKFYVVDVSKCFGYFISAGITIGDIFQDALEHKSLSVILFENIDKMYDRSVPDFLSDVNSIPPGKMLVIATARDRERLDDRLFQIQELGRFDYTFEIELPNFTGRVDILKSHFSRKNCPILPQDILELAKTTVSFNAGELERFASLIHMKAIKIYTRHAKTNVKTPIAKSILASETNQKKIPSRRHLRKRSKTKQSLSKVSGSMSSVDDYFNYDSDSEDFITQVLHWAFGDNK